MTEQCHHWRITPHLVTKPIYVIVCDAQPVYRDGIARIIRQARGVQLRSEVGSVEALLEAIAARLPDVVIVDPSSVGADVVALLGSIARRSALTRVVVVAGVAGPMKAYRALGAGAAAYLSKAATQEHVREAVFRAACGEVTIARELQPGVATQIKLHERPDVPPLSPRQREILALVADGRATRTIAAELYVTPSTVRAHLQRICEKLGVHDRAGAVAAALRQGIMD